MFSNDEAHLTLHKEALNGMFQDYVIKFNQEYLQIEQIIPLAYDIVKQLMEKLNLDEKVVKGRLVALVCYIRKETNDVVQIYHPSYKSEVIIEAENFFTNHMMKIAQRIENFNQNGSSLLIKSIPEIHLHVSCSSK